MENWVFQVQQMLTDKLDAYRRKGNTYVNDNIWEIQEIYRKEETKKEEGRIEDKKVILVRLYEVSTTTSASSQTSFIMDKVENLVKYMKFIWAPMQTRIFWLSPHYQSLKSRGEQNPEFWKEITIALVDQKHNTEMTRNGYTIIMFQGGLLHEPYFIAINNWGQVLIGPNKKIVPTHVVGELEVLVWFMRTWMLKQEYCYNQYLKDAG